MSGVLQNIDPHPLTARRVCSTPSPLVRGEDTLAGWRGKSHRNFENRMRAVRENFLIHNETINALVYSLDTISSSLSSVSSCAACFWTCRPACGAVSCPWPAAVRPSASPHPSWPPAFYWLPLYSAAACFPSRSVATWTIIFLPGRHTSICWPPLGPPSVQLLFKRI